MKKENENEKVQSKVEKTVEHKDKKDVTPEENHAGLRTPPKWCTAAGHMVHPAAGEITLSYPCACALTRPRSEPCTRCR